MKDPLLNHPTPGDEQRARWAEWAAKAEPRACPACQRDFQPSHPWRRFCGRPDCPGRPGRARTRGSRAPADPRGAQLQGVFAEVIMAARSADLDGTREEVAVAIRAWMKAETKDIPPSERRAALVALQAACAARTIALDNLVE